MSVKEIKVDNILGIKEIATLLNMKSAGVCNYIKRYEDFPKPIKVLCASPLFNKEDILAWVNSNNTRIENMKKVTKVRKTRLKIPSVLDKETK